MCSYQGCRQQGSRNLERIFRAWYDKTQSKYLKLIKLLFSLLTDANCPINIDSKSYEITKKNMESNPNNRWIFDEAAGHVYQLMKNDSYPRYLRSDMYKEYLNGTKKKVNITMNILELIISI